MQRVFSIVLASLHLDRKVSLSNVVWPAEAIGWCGSHDPMLEHDDPWFGGCLQSVPPTDGIHVVSRPNLSVTRGSSIRLSEVVLASGNSAFVKVEISGPDGKVQRAELRIDEHEAGAVVSNVCMPNPTWQRPPPED